MSHPSNDDFLERAQENFADAETREERDAVVQLLRVEGFETQANYLAQFVEEGIDESD